jgi:2-dehydropantoate 2-reductase
VEVAKWPSIAVMGAGAVGCYFGGMLARAGAPVTFIGRPLHVESIAKLGLLLETAKFQQRLKAMATTKLEAARDADVVLFCVKALDTEDAAKALAPHLAKDALVVSLQNGVDNAERMRAAAGIDAIPAVVYVAAEMIAPGHVKHNGRGDLVIGELPRTVHRSRRDELEALAGHFIRAEIPCRVSDNIESELWTKMIINSACNAISALSRAKYGRIVAHPLTRDLLVRIIEEAVAVGYAAGVRLSKDQLIDAMMKLGDSMGNATSSTAQDIARGKRTEIDSFNGYVALRGAELGVPTPVNHTLRALVKLLEEGGIPSQSMGT